MASSLMAIPAEMKKPIATSATSLAILKLGHIETRNPVLYGALMEWRIPRRPALLPAGFIEPCYPTVSKKAPSGPNWIHEIKHTGIGSSCVRTPSECARPCDSTALPRGDAAIYLRLISA
jgi:hypothetical protein